MQDRSVSRYENICTVTLCGGVEVGMRRLGFVAHVECSNPSVYMLRLGKCRCGNICEAILALSVHLR